MSPSMKVSGTPTRGAHPCAHTQSGGLANPNMGRSLGDGASSSPCALGGELKRSAGLAGLPDRTGRREPLMTTHQSRVSTTSKSRSNADRWFYVIVTTADFHGSAHRACGWPL